jgi:ABC-type transport system substrate-binding protein
MRSLSLLLFVVWLGAACAPAGPASRSGGEPGAPSPSPPQKVLQIINRGEPPGLASQPLAHGAGALAAAPARFFNATLDVTDVREIAHSQLAEALPQFDTDTWRLNPDGTMQTRYRLRANLTWHDGTPLHAEDFVFAYRVYKTPDLGTAGTTPFGQMAGVLAPDARTVVINWNRPYVAAGLLGPDFQALPRHILEEDYQRLEAVAFTNHPFWSTAYVGLGPYRLDRWEPGAWLAASAFDNYVLGRPKINEIRIRFINDAQTVMANVLAGEIHYVTSLNFSTEQAVVLEQEFARSGAGRVLSSATQRRLGLFQMRPEYQSPSALSNVNVRYAVAHGLDHQARVDVVDAGKGAVAHALTHFGVPGYAEIDRVVLKHDYDPRTAEALMAQQGWTRGTDGVFANAAGEKFTIELESSSGSKNEQEAAVYVASLRQTGFDAIQKVTPVAAARDGEYRATRPGLSLRGGSAELFIDAGIPSPANRWQGNNRGGWANAEYNRRFAQLEQTFIDAERIALTAELERLISVDRALTMNTWEADVWTVASDLLGVEPMGSPDAGGPETGAHLWHWKQ